MGAVWVVDDVEATDVDVVVGAAEGSDVAVVQAAAEMASNMDKAITRITGS